MRCANRFTSSFEDFSTASWPNSTSASPPSTAPFKNVWSDVADPPSGALARLGTALLAWANAATPKARAMTVLKAQRFEIIFIGIPSFGGYDMNACCNLSGQSGLHGTTRKERQ